MLLSAVVGQVYSEVLDEDRVLHLSFESQIMRQAAYLQMYVLLTL